MSLQSVSIILLLAQCNGQSANNTVQKEQCHSSCSSFSSSRKISIKCDLCRVLGDLMRESTVELLPGLKNFTENQQMWLAEALADCGSSEFSEKSQTYRMSKRQWQTGVHAKGAFRLYRAPLQQQAIQRRLGLP